MRSEITSVKLTKSRRAAREAALKALYQIQIGGQSPEKSIEDVLALNNFAPETTQFARRLVHGVLGAQGELSKEVAACLTSEWTLDRVAIIDKLLLFIAAYEIFNIADMPPKVSINEAVTLAKQYSTAESGKFINGVLGALLKRSPKKEEI